MKCTANIWNFYEKNAMHCKFLADMYEICNALQIFLLVSLESL